mmetsp:Transcript_33496/g.75168  ORF Transcript_33496/g.75168 Transcript_33496/m.75168 type:complete len:211 (-) Transcript_33496:1484-2116(-)
MASWIHLDVNVEVLLALALDDRQEVLVVDISVLDLPVVAELVVNRLTGVFSLLRLRARDSRVSLEILFSHIPPDDGVGSNLLGRTEPDGRQQRGRILEAELSRILHVVEEELHRILRRVWGSVGLEACQVLREFHRAQHATIEDFVDPGFLADLVPRVLDRAFEPFRLHLLLFILRAPELHEGLHVAQLLHGKRFMQEVQRRGVIRGFKI